LSDHFQNITSVPARYPVAAVEQRQQVIASKTETFAVGDQIIHRQLIQALDSHNLLSNSVFAISVLQ